ncbi:MAG: hypothetical protein GY841_03280 [FCB group bacterium]|nr:hypothetical protein [FCB group bacterium]
MISKRVPAFLLMFLLVLTLGVQADVSLKKAIKIGEKNIKKLTDQSYHYRIEYDTILALPVHSKTIYKNDFYLLYFLKGNQFQAEVEVDKKTGDPTLLALDKMAPPCYQLLHGNFPHLYFNTDSMMVQGQKRFRIEQDSVRLVYFGVIPRLGKRGVIWELSSPQGAKYVSTGGMTIQAKTIYRDMNLSKYMQGNYMADSLRLAELVDEITRLGDLNEEQISAVKLTPESRDEQIKKFKGEMQGIYGRFPNLIKIIKLESDPPPDSTK